MDIARSIDFDCLDNNVDKPSSVLKKDRGIDVNHQFDLYTTSSTSEPAEAPPVYQKDQSHNGAISNMAQPFQPSDSAKPPNPPKFILRTVPKIQPQPLRIGSSHGRPADEVTRSLQHPKALPTPGNENLLWSDSVNNGVIEHTHPEETTVLCELTGASMDYTQPDESMPGKMGMVKGASTCTVRVTSRKKQVVGGGVRVVRSIWVFADNGDVCIQQKLPHGAKIIPYTLWSSETKVIIHYPTELRCYANAKAHIPYRKTNTSWVTYAFPSIPTAADFQSALLSPLKLMKTLPTSRVMRLHPSPFMRAFSPRLQLCGLENLRIFHDVTDPNALVCMIHYSPNFRPSNGDEYVEFRLYPPPRNSVRIREDGEKCVKIKGLDIRGSPAGEQLKKKKGKAPVSRAECLEEEAYGSESVEKIQIEFESGAEKRQFLEMTRELQGLVNFTDMLRYLNAKGVPGSSVCDRLLRVQEGLKL